MIESAPGDGARPSRLTAVARLPQRHRWMLLQAILLLPVTHLLLRLAGLRRTYALLCRPGPPAQSDRTAAWRAPHELLAAARLVDAAARHSWPASTCLHRSLTLWWLLRRRGVRCELCVGARRQDSGLDAHAWVAFDGLVLNDDAERVREYVPLPWTFAGGPR